MEKVKEQQQAVGVLLATIGIIYGLDKDVAIPLAKMLAEQDGVPTAEAAMHAVDEIRAFAKEWDAL